MKKIGLLVSAFVIGSIAVVSIATQKKPIVQPAIASGDSSVPASSGQTPTSIGGTISRWFSDDEDDDEDRTPSTPVAVPPPATTPKNYAALYKDGTYTANGTYMSPGGQDEIKVTLTLKSDIVTDATVVTVIADHTSQRYQDKFISGYKQYVVGQNISSLNVTVVSGSSLTSTGFNNALAKIKTQAKA
ncbi:MAG TPA: hypothetical protein VL335_00920 [Candidatus Paceibacterota bacterium]|jgi:uncharacterized protein with FMN-binding domain|nr:hypothetical protein [Candidatus Paceibacterota bacterium]